MQRPVPEVNDTVSINLNRYFITNVTNIEGTTYIDIISIQNPQEKISFYGTYKNWKVIGTEKPILLKIFKNPSNENYSIQDFDTLFEAVKILGRGSYGQVFLINTKPAYTKLSENSKVTIKLIQKRLILESQILVFNEIDTLKTLSQMSNCHPNISCYYDSLVVKLNNVIYWAIVMEYIEGSTLEDIIGGISQYSLINGEKYDMIKYYDNEKIVGIMKVLASTIQFMHDRHIVHRDIKPINIIVSNKNNNLVYIDFGLSCFTTYGIEDYGKSCSQQQIGSQLYFSPELETIETRKLKKKELFEILLKSDIWALGLTIFHFLFGEDLDMYDKFAPKKLYPEFPTKTNVDIRIIEILRHMLDRDYKTRYNGKEILQKMEKIMF